MISKAFPPKPRRQFQHFYRTGGELFAVLERRSDSQWHIVDPKSIELGVFPTREFAISFINAKIADPPAAPIAGERQADAERVNQIRHHQQQAKAYRARRSGTR